MTLDKLSSEIWNVHVKSSVFTTINYTLAVAYGFSLNFLSAAASGIAAGTLTYLAVEYKNAYNKITSNPDWAKIKYQLVKHFEDLNKNYIRRIRFAK